MWMDCKVKEIGWFVCSFVRSFGARQYESPAHCTRLVLLLTRACSGWGSGGGGMLVSPRILNLTGAADSFESAASSTT